MRNIVDIVENEIIARMDNRVMVLSFAGKKVTVCNAKWARKNKVFTGTDNLPNLIVNVVGNDIFLELDYTGGTGYASIELPIYFHGTPRVTNTEWKASGNNEAAKVPFIWLVEPVNEEYQNEESVIERNSDIQILICDSRDGTNWTNNDIHSQRSNTLYALADEFIASVKRNRKFARFTNYRERNLTKLGTENLNGFEKNIIDSDLTAIEIRLTLPIYKTSNCNC